MISEKITQLELNRLRETTMELRQKNHEMLEALEHCLAYFKKYNSPFCGIHDDRDCSPYNDALQAIKKAKGEI